MTRIIIVGLAALALAGCASTKPLEVASITPIRSGAGTVGSDVYAVQRRRGESVPDLAADQILQIRSYKYKEGAFGGESAGKEIAGANCKVKARYFSADVVTPAKVRVPIYRQQSSPINVSCAKPGYHTRTKVVEVYNKTKSDRHNNMNSAAASAGLIGAVVGSIAVAAINASSDENTHEFKYVPARMILKPIASKKKAKGKPKTASL